MSAAWGDGWGSSWGAGSDPSSTDAPEAATDRMNRALRVLIQSAMGMPPGSVRPANQIAPRGNQTAEFATVLIADAINEGWAETTYAVQPDTSVVESVEIQQRLYVSVQFFKAPNKDRAGIVKYSKAAFDRASRLPNRLQLSQFSAMMQQMGFGYVSHGRPRDLTDISDATWESRGQVDLEFYVIAREAGPMDVFTSFGAGIFVQTPDGAIHEQTITGVTT